MGWGQKKRERDGIGVQKECVIDRKREKARVMGEEAEGEIIECDGQGGIKRKSDELGRQKESALNPGFFLEVVISGREGVEAAHCFQ